MIDPLDEEGGEEPENKTLRPVLVRRVAWLRIAIVAALAAVLAVLATFIF